MSNRIYVFPNLKNIAGRRISAISLEDAFRIFASEFSEPITEEHLIVEDDLGNIIDCTIRDSHITCKVTIKNSSDCLLTTEDIDPLTKKYSLKDYKKVFGKLKSNIEQQNINHKIKADNYTDLFFTSDLHADYRKFVQLLKNGGFVKFPETDNMYDPRLISECEWLKKDCLIIIIGDLVDGRRVTPLIQLQKKNTEATEVEIKAEITDEVGNFELLLHMLIYNLRIKGKKCNSEILFTIGNHDLEMLLDENNYLQEFVHRNALTYYKDEDINPYKIRRFVLSHFYAFSPYVLLVLQTETNENEILCIHAGIHKKEGSYDLDKIMAIQERINEEGLCILKDQLIDDLYIKGDLKKESRNSALRDRYYATGGKELCEKNKDFPYLLTVVGHSPSQGNYRELENVQLKGDEYRECDTKDNYKGRGCIVYKCPHHENEMPRIVLVDTALSESLTNDKSGRKRETEQTRSIEFLHLTHVESTRESSNYFNRMFKYLINNVDNNAQDEQIYPKITSSAQQKYLKYKAKYLQLKKIN